MRQFFRFALFLSLSCSSAFAQSDRSDYQAKIRDWVRSHAAKRVLPTIAPDRNDLAAGFVDELRYTSLAKMEEAKLLSARLETGPWSGSYWPTYAGSIANRYADPNFIPSMIWKENARYLDSVVGRGGSRELSPAEKYDLLIGDSAFTLTKSMIQAGAPYAERDGSVPTWFGICHGWAPASFMEKRPSHSVKAKAADGRELIFTPTDLKALLSLLWANGAGETRFIGGRCNENGNNRDPQCRDNNPATWHLSVVNQIGVAKRSFVADVSPGAEVWNQPAFGYNYSYSNPVTGAAAATLQEAKVLRSSWAGDPRAATRAADSVSVVKVMMRFEYGSENSAGDNGEDRPEMDSHATQNFIYELELDAEDNIVGGEWLSTSHPDFLWVPVQNSKASSVGDEALDRQNDHSSWELSAVVPRAWRSAARLSSKNDQPLGRIVEQLLEAAASAQ